MPIQIIQGPPSAKISRKVAEEKLKSHPEFPKEADFQLDQIEVDGIAAIHTAAPFGEDGPPVPADEPELPGDDAPEPESEPEEKPEEDGPPKEDGEEKGEKGLEAKVEHLTDLLTKVVDALGLGEHPEDSPVPGDELPPPGPPEEPGVGKDNKTHTVHERALKPGEAPPGTTPIGAPAFSSTQVPDDHPWKDHLGQARSFNVGPEPIGEAKLAEVKSELDELAKPYGYRVARLIDPVEDGQRVAKAVIAKA